MRVVYIALLWFGHYPILNNFILQIAKYGANVHTYTHSTIVLLSFSLFHCTSVHYRKYKFDVVRACVRVCKCYTSIIRNELFSFYFSFFSLAFSHPIRMFNCTFVSLFRLCCFPSPSSSLSLPSPSPSKKIKSFFTSISFSFQFVLSSLCVARNTILLCSSNYTRFLGVPLLVTHTSKCDTCTRAHAKGGREREYCKCMLVVKAK